MRSKPRKSTQREIEQRVSECADMLASGAEKHQATAHAKETWGVSARMAEIYVARARERIVADSGKSKDSWRAESTKFYADVSADESVSMADRLRADRKSGV